MTARRTSGSVILAATGLLLVGCGGSGSAESHASTAPSMSRSTSSTAPPTTVSEAPADPASAPSAASMVCSKEVRANIAKLLNLPEPPQGRATWANHRYTCGYDLAAGHLMLTVQESSSDTAAKNYLANRRTSFANTRPITGLESLGLPAFQNRTGITAFVKDNFTLVVDASHLSGRLGQHGVTRTDFSYALATDVLACWSS